MNYLFIVLLFLPNLLTNEAKLNYPHWFIYPSDNDSLIVGYSYGKTPSIVDAATRFTIYKKSKVSGRQEVLVSESKENSFVKNSDYYYDYSKDSANFIQSCLIPIYQFSSNRILGEFITLFSMDSVKVSVNKTVINLNTLPIPDWVDSVAWKSGNAFFGVGTYTIKSNENDAWRVAEDRAIIEVLNLYSLKIGTHQTLTRNSKQDGLEEYFIRQFNHQIKRVHVVARWVDKRFNNACVLIKIESVSLL